MFNQNSCPYKFKAFHLVNVPMILNWTVSIIRMVVPNKIRKRIHTHGYSMQSLHKYFEPDMLPTWLGGTLDDEVAEDRALRLALHTPEKQDWYEECISLYK
jgi:hypothetical protein